MMKWRVTHAQLFSYFAARTSVLFQNLQSNSIFIYIWLWHLHINIGPTMLSNDKIPQINDIPPSMAFYYRGVRVKG